MMQAIQVTEFMHVVLYYISSNELNAVGVVFIISLGKKMSLAELLRLYDQVIEIYILEILK